MTLAVALIQTRTPSTQEAALGPLEALIREAAAGGARFIATPEGSNLLQRRREIFLETAKEEGEDPVARRLSDLAFELGVEILAGSLLVRRAEGGFANRALLFGTDGRIKARYDKIHMFDVDLPNGESPRESRTYEPGDRAVIAPSCAGPLGLTICYDVRFPYLYRVLAQAGAEVMMVPAAFTKPTGEAHWEVLLRARAIETGAFVLAPAQGGTHDDGRVTFGRTLAVGPWGEILAILDHAEPGVLRVDLDLDAVKKARRAIPALAKDRAFSGPEPVRAAAE